MPTRLVQMRNLWKKMVKGVDATLYRRVGEHLTATRPDIILSTSLSSKFMHCWSLIHLGAAKEVCWDISGRLGIIEICYATLVGYGDSNLRWLSG